MLEIYKQSFILPLQKSINGINLPLTKLKVLKSSIILVLVFITVLWACDPCTDCGPVEREPSIQLEFRDQSGLISNSVSLTVVDTLIVASESLDDINARIDDGEQDLENNKLKFEEFIDGLTDLRGTAENLTEALSALRIVLSRQISDQENGLVLIDRLLNVDSNLDSIFQDSAANYSLPLNFTSNLAEYYISINGITDTLELGYDLFDEIDPDHRVLRRAQNIEVKSHSFDSLVISCDSVNFDCNAGLLLDKETIMTCYF